MTLPDALVLGAASGATALPDAGDLATALPPAAFPAGAFFAEAFFAGAGAFLAGTFFAGADAFLAGVFFAGDAAFFGAFVAAVAGFFGGALAAAPFLAEAACFAGALAAVFFAAGLGAAFFVAFLATGFDEDLADDLLGLFNFCSLPETVFDFAAETPTLVDVFPLYAFTAVELALVFAISLHRGWPGGRVL